MKQSVRGSDVLKNSFNLLLGIRVVTHWKQAQGGKGLSCYNFFVD